MRNSWRMNELKKKDIMSKIMQEAAAMKDPIDVELNRRCFSQMKYIYIYIYIYIYQDY
jgi:hypothetical protein